METAHLLPLLGVLVVIAGFGARLHPMAVVAASAVVTGLAARMPVVRLLTIVGEAFTKNRFLMLFILTLPIIGLLERRGLRERAKAVVAALRRATPGRLFIAYQVLRQGTAALGLIGLGGHAQTVRPLLAPMAEAAAEKLRSPLPPSWREKILAYAAATDNVAVFFGEDVFLAFGAVLLVRGFFLDRGIALEPLAIAAWAAPTAAAALVVHAARSARLDAKLRGEREP